MKIIKKEVARLISASIGIDVKEAEELLAVPPKNDMGDICFPCFKMAQHYKRKPNELASELSEKISKSIGSDAFVDSVKPLGPYVNFTAKKELVYAGAIQAVLEDIKKGFKKDPNGKTVVIDYSSPNIAKPIAFHHIRSTAIGNIIGNIFESLGYNVVRINYLGDWGTQFGKLITAFEIYGDQKKLEKDGIKHLLEIYVKYHKNESDELEKKAREWFKKMEDGDAKALEYWERFRDISIKEFERVYRRLGVTFTHIEGESLYNKSTEEVIDKINKTIGSKESEGALIVDLESFNMPPVLLKKQDDTALYATRDLAAAFDRMQRFNFEESLYVVAHQQELHFKQIFKVLELMGCEWASKCKHVQFGLLHLADGKMSTREGNVVFLEEVLDRSVELAKKAIEEKNPELEGKEEVAEAVGVGAIIFGDISKRRNQDIIFKWEDVLNFDGETAPYVQYTHARACSILRKTGFKAADIKKNSSHVPDDVEYEMIKMMTDLEDRLEDARAEHEPFIVARYVLDLCRIFNRYYYQEKIIDIEDQKKRTAKLAMVFCVKEVIKAALSIIGIKAPERM